MALLTTPVAGFLGAPSVLARDENSSFNGTYDGDFVDFLFNQTTGTITNYTYNSTLLFGTITLTNFTMEKLEVKDEGLESKSDEVKLEISDNHSAKFEIKAYTNMTVSIEHNATLSIIDNMTLALNWSNCNGTLEIGPKNASPMPTYDTLSNTTINITLYNETKLEFKLGYGPGDDDNGSGGNDDDNGNNGNNDNKDKDKDTGKPSALTPGTFSGKYIDFLYDLENSTLANLSFLTNQVFQNVTMENGSFVTQQVHNHLFKGEGDNIKLNCHDNPTALIQIKAPTNATVLFNLSGGWSASQVNSTSMNLTDNNLSARMVIVSQNGTFLSVSNSSIQVFMHSNAQIHFYITQVVNTTGLNTSTVAAFMFTDTQGFILESIAGSFCGGMVVLDGAVESYDEGFTLLVNSLDQEGANIIVDSTGTTGRLVLIAYPGAQIPQLEVQLDGEHLERYQDLGSLGRGISGYYFIHGEQGFQVLVSIDHFSTREITLRFPTPDPGDIPDHDIDEEDTPKDDLPDEPDKESDDDEKDDVEDDEKDGTNDKPDVIDPDDIDGSGDIGPDNPSDESLSEKVAQAHQNMLAAVIMAILIIIAGTYLYLIRK